MKKLVSVILSVTMIFSFATCGFAAAKEPPSTVLISADESFTSAITSNAESVVAGLHSLVNTSKRVYLKTPDVTELARLGFVTSVYTGQDYGEEQYEEYVIYKAADGSLYTMKNNKLYKLSSEDTFYRLVDESGAGFYKFRSIPAAKLGSLTIPVTFSGYSFKKLDGLFYNTQYTPAEDIPAMDEKNGAIKIPQFSVEPKSVKVTVTYHSDKKLVWSGDISEVGGFKPEKSGDYIVKYSAVYENPYYSGEVVYGYLAAFTAKPKGISFSAESWGASGDGAVTSPGETVILRALNIPEGEKITVKSNINFTPSFFRQKNGDMAALLPVNYYTSPDNYYVELSCGGITQRLAVNVRTKKFVEQYLTVPPSTAEATINSQKANDEFEKYIAPVRKISDGKQYWSGRFIWPLKQTTRRTTEFGAIRYTNGDMKNPSRHGGIDFAAPAGTPVYAPAAGRVVYSGYLQLTGHTICIEHGYGLKTWYYHMNGRSVETGGMVKQGQQIGVVGSTGFSTGAHLHYAMSVSNAASGNVYVNPETSVTTDMFAGF